MTKQEKIKEAWREDYNKYNPDDNGWSKLLIFGDFRDDRFDKFDSSGRKIYNVRPKSLSGIENNNGWIKIESEDDLPEETGTYFTYSKVWWKPFYRIDVFTGRLKNSFTDGKSCFTHYQPIIKPQPPLY